MSERHICPSCKNHFVQPFTCISCGAETLRDNTMRSLEKEVLELRQQLAEAEAQNRELKDADRISGYPNHKALLAEMGE